MDREWRRPAAGVAMLVFFLLAGRAGASSVYADAEGAVFGTGASDLHTGDGLTPVAAAAGYETPAGPSGGTTHMSAAAAVGSLGARADLSISDAPGPLISPYYTSGYAEGDARFQDRWTFGGQPLDTPGMLRVTLHFDGAASASATGASPIGIGRFLFDISSLAEFGNPYAEQSYDSGQVQLANDDRVLELAFLYGRPILVNGTLVARVAVEALPDSTVYSGGGAANFDQTARITALEVQDPQGQWTTTYALTTESGGRYPFQVPEPSRAAEAATACAALALRHRRAAQARPSRTS